MAYAKFKEDGSLEYEIYHSGNIEWDSTHLCPALALTTEEAAQFRVFPLLEVDQPAITEYQTATRNGVEQDTDGNWVQSWIITNFTEDKILAHNQAKSKELQNVIITLVQNYLDDFAKGRNYDSILSAATYSTSIVPRFAAEGVIAANARDQTWEALYTIMDEVSAGTRPVPTSFDDIKASLPVLSWT